ncbi:MAG: 50S ribosomal protein L11 methyltransferase, partial [Vicinamibacterales bacterium]
MPYRIDLACNRPSDAESVFDRLVELGALDVEPTAGGLAAILPDGVSPEAVMTHTGQAVVSVSSAIGLDDGSVWVLRRRPVRAGRWGLVPEGPEDRSGPEDPEGGSGPEDPEGGSGPAAPSRSSAAAAAPAAIASDGRGPVIRLVNGAAFGTGLHPTTILCLEILDEILGGLLAESPDEDLAGERLADVTQHAVEDPTGGARAPAAAPVDHRRPPLNVLDVGTGSGVLALAALTGGASHATGVDIDAEALRVAGENARLNGVADRLRLVHGDVAAVDGHWAIVTANVLAAPLIEMAPALARRLSHAGRLVLSGIPASVAPEVERAYRRLGLVHRGTRSRGGWTALVF